MTDQPINSLTEALGAVYDLALEATTNEQEEIDMSDAINAPVKTNTRKAICHGYRYRHYGRGCGQTLAPGEGLLYEDEGHYMCPAHYAMRTQVDEQRPRQLLATAKINDWLSVHALYEYQNQHDTGRVIDKSEPNAALVAEAILAHLEALTPADGALLEYAVICAAVREAAESALLSVEDIESDTLPTMARAAFRQEMAAEA